MKIFCHNTLTKKKEELTPLKEGEFRLYSCGPTTYDFLHIGNARAQVVGDLFFRVLKAFDYDVIYVRNFTDVDDKIIERARENGRTPLEHSQIFIKECTKDMNSLGLLPATHTPKVSETIEEIISMIQTLEKKGVAYNVDGEVFYHVSEFKEYGKLSRRKLDEQLEGARVEVDKRKKAPHDFVLWKPAKEGEETCSWDSPWGKGRPGWHIECSAMSKKFLGETFDIHHGGIDLIFPHHENEIAQSEACNEKHYARYWLHNEFVNFGTEKMSKSLGNVIRIRDFVEKYTGEVLRQIFVDSHYRAPLEWSDDLINKSIHSLERIHEFFADILQLYPDLESIPCDKNAKIVLEMKTELANDFNTPAALGHFFSFIRDIRRDYLDKKRPIDKKTLSELASAFHFASLAFGNISFRPQELLNRLNNVKAGLQENAYSADKVEGLLEERKQAKQERDFQRADEIRDELKNNGVLIQDHPTGETSWKYA